MTAGMLKINLKLLKTFLRTLSIHFKTSSSLQVLTGYYVCILEILEVKKEKNGAKGGG